jgi:tetratricopeptide (TPR) repeat protein
MQRETPPVLGLEVANELQCAAASFSQAWSLWDSGDDAVGLLSKAHLLDREASLRRAQGNFVEALKLHHEALESAQLVDLGDILLSKAITLGEKGDYEGSIEALERADREVDGERQPRLLFSVRFNRAANLVRLGRAREAVPLVGEVRALAERLRNELDLVRTLWLEGNTLAGVGGLAEASAALAQVCRAFGRKLPFDHALAGLDLALVYQKEGRLEEVQQLAVELLNIFQAHEAYREATAALILFRDAAARGVVTEDLVRRLQDYLSKASRNPGLRFEPCR